MKQQELVFLAAFTFIVIVAWAGFSIYHVAQTSTLSKEQTKLIIPITPAFDIQTLDALKKRNVVQPSLRAAAGGTNAISASATLTPPSLTSGQPTPPAPQGSISPAQEITLPAGPALPTQSALPLKPIVSPTP